MAECDGEKDYIGSPPSSTQIFCKRFLRGYKRRLERMIFKPGSGCDVPAASGTVIKLIEER